MKKKCEKDELEVCDFCLHFLMFRGEEGETIDGTGYCGLQRRKVDYGEGCRRFYCKKQWAKNMRKNMRKMR